MPVLADQVYALGESLYELIYSEAQCDDPAKVTGMLLQLDADAVRSLIASPERRSTMVAEAVAVLKAATASHDNPSSDCYRSSHVPIPHSSSQSSSRSHGERAHENICRGAKGGSRSRSRSRSRSASPLTRDGARDPPSPSASSAAAPTKRLHVGGLTSAALTEHERLHPQPTRAPARARSRPAQGCISRAAACVSISPLRSEPEQPSSPLEPSHQAPPPPRERPEGLTVPPAPAHGGASTSAPGVIQLEAAPAEGGETVSDTAVAARAARCGSQAPASGGSPTGALASGPLPLREALRRAQGLEREVRREVERYALGEDNLKRLVEERGGTFRAAVARAVVDKIAEFILVAKRRRRDKSYALRATAEVSAKEACANLETLRKNLRKQAEGRRWK